MHVIRQGKGEVAMTEGELAKFFGVSWQKVNHKVRLISFFFHCYILLHNYIKGKALKDKGLTSSYNVEYIINYNITTFLNICCVLAYPVCNFATKIN